MPISELEILTYAGRYLEERLTEIRQKTIALMPARRGPAKKKKSVVALAEESGAVEPEKKRVGKGNAQSDYWAKMTPKQRKAEMSRRKALWPKKSQKAWRGKKTPIKSAAKKTVGIKDNAREAIEALRKEAVA